MLMDNNSNISDALDHSFREHIVQNQKDSWPKHIVPEWPGRTPLEESLPLKFETRKGKCAVNKTVVIADRPMSLPVFARRFEPILDW
jgi:hypothetical protein